MSLEVGKGIILGYFSSRNLTCSVFNLTITAWGMWVEVPK